MVSKMKTQQGRRPTKMIVSPAKTKETISTVSKPARKNPPLDARDDTATEKIRDDCSDKKTDSSKDQKVVVDLKPAKQVSSKAAGASKTTAKAGASKSAKKPPTPTKTKDTIRKAPTSSAPQKAKAITKGKTSTAKVDAGKTLTTNGKPSTAKVDSRKASSIANSRKKSLSPKKKRLGLFGKKKAEEPTTTIPDPTFDPNAIIAADRMEAYLKSQHYNFQIGSFDHSLGASSSFGSTKNTDKYFFAQSNSEDSIPEDPTEDWEEEMNAAASRDEERDGNNDDDAKDEIVVEKEDVNTSHDEDHNKDREMENVIVEQKEEKDGDKKEAASAAVGIEGRDKKDRAQGVVKEKKKKEKTKTLGKKGKVYKKKDASKDVVEKDINKTDKKDVVAIVDKKDDKADAVNVIVDNKNDNDGDADSDASSMTNGSDTSKHYPPVEFSESGDMMFITTRRSRDFSFRDSDSDNSLSANEIAPQNREIQPPTVENEITVEKEQPPKAKPSADLDGESKLYRKAKGQGKGIPLPPGGKDRPAASAQKTKCVKGKKKNVTSTTKKTSGKKSETTKGREKRLLKKALKKSAADGKQKDALGKHTKKTSLSPDGARTTPTDSKPTAKSDELITEQDTPAVVNERKSRKSPQRKGRDRYAMDLEGLSVSESHSESSSFLGFKIRSRSPSPVKFSQSLRQPSAESPPTLPPKPPEKVKTVVHSFFVSKEQPPSIETGSTGFEVSEQLQDIPIEVEKTSSHDSQDVTSTDPKIDPDAAERDEKQIEGSALKARENTQATGNKNRKGQKTKSPLNVKRQRGLDAKKTPKKKGKFFTFGPSNKKKQLVAAEKDVDAVERRELISRQLLSQSLHSMESDEEGPGRYDLARSFSSDERRSFASGESPMVKNTNLQVPGANPSSRSRSEDGSDPKTLQKQIPAGEDSNYGAEYLSLSSHTFSNEEQESDRYKSTPDLIPSIDKVSAREIESESSQSMPLIGEFSIGTAEDETIEEKGDGFEVSLTPGAVSARQFIGFDDISDPSMPSPQRVDSASVDEHLDNVAEDERPTERQKDTLRGRSRIVGKQKKKGKSLFSFRSPTQDAKIDRTNREMTVSSEEKASKSRVKISQPRLQYVRGEPITFSSGKEMVDSLDPSAQIPTDEFQDEELREDTPDSIVPAQQTRDLHDSPHEDIKDSNNEDSQNFSRSSPKPEHRFSSALSKENKNKVKKQKGSASRDTKPRSASRPRTGTFLSRFSSPKPDRPRAFSVYEATDVPPSQKSEAADMAKVPDKDKKQQSIAVEGQEDDDRYSSSHQDTESVQATTESAMDENKKTDLMSNAILQQKAKENDPPSSDEDNPLLGETLLDDESARNDIDALQETHRSPLDKEAADDDKAAKQKEEERKESLEGLSNDIPKKRPEKARSRKLTPGRSRFSPWGRKEKTPEVTVLERARTYDADDSMAPTQFEMIYEPTNEKKKKTKGPTKLLSRFKSPKRESPEDTSSNITTFDRSKHTSKQRFGKAEARKRKSSPKRHSVTSPKSKPVYKPPRESNNLESGVNKAYAPAYKEHHKVKNHWERMPENVHQTEKNTPDGVGSDNYTTTPEPKDDQLLILVDREDEPGSPSPDDDEGNAIPSMTSFAGRAPVLGSPRNKSPRSETSSKVAFATDDVEDVGQMSMPPVLPMEPEIMQDNVNMNVAENKPLVKERSSDSSSRGRLLSLFRTRSKTDEQEPQAMPRRGTSSFYGGGADDVLGTQAAMDEMQNQDMNVNQLIQQRVELLRSRPSKRNSSQRPPLAPENMHPQSPLARKAQGLPAEEPITPRNAFAAISRDDDSSNGDHQPSLQYMPSPEVFEGLENPKQADEASMNRDSNMNNMYNVPIPANSQQGMQQVLSAQNPQPVAHQNPNNSNHMMNPSFTPYNKEGVIPSLFDETLHDSSFGTDSLHTGDRRSSMRSDSKAARYHKRKKSSASRASVKSSKSTTSSRAGFFRSRSKEAPTPERRPPPIQITRSRSRNSSASNKDDSKLRKIRSNNSSNHHRMEGLDRHGVSAMLADGSPAIISHMTSEERQPKSKRGTNSSKRSSRRRPKKNSHTAVAMEVIEKHAARLGVKPSVLIAAIQDVDQQTYAQAQLAQLARMFDEEQNNNNHKIKNIAFEDEDDMSDVSNESFADLEEPTTAYEEFVDMISEFFAPKKK